MVYLGSLGALATVYVLYILARLSERLGSVEKMRPLYRYYYWAMGLVFISFLAQLLVVYANSMANSALQWLTSPWFTLASHYLPLAAGVTIGIYVTWQYWSWLITESEK
jgi:hypothetical protein